MLMVGMDGTVWHDGQEWHSLLNTIELQPDDNGSDDTDICSEDNDSHESFSYSTDYSSTCR